MLYLIWGLLNVGLLIYFLTICFNAIKLVRREIGLFAAIVFVIGLLSFCSRHDDQERTAALNKTKTWTFASNDSLTRIPTSLLDVELQRNLISKYGLTVTCAKDRNGLNIPISAFTTTEGFLLGTDWHAMTISVEKTKENNKLEYYVHALVEWHLLGISVYTQSKEFKGIILVN